MQNPRYEALKEKVAKDSEEIKASAQIENANRTIMHFLSNNSTYKHKRKVALVANCRTNPLLHSPMTPGRLPTRTSRGLTGSRATGDSFKRLEPEPLLNEDLGVSITAKPDAGRPCLHQCDCI